MGKSIPSSLPFLEKSLTLEESVAFLDWYNLLSLADKRNVGKVLRASYDKAAFHTYYYFVMNAIGGTARAEPDYDDVDLLLFTNLGLRGWNRIRDLDLGLNLRVRDDFNYAWDMSPREAYFREDRPDRLILRLTPRRGEGKNIHLTLQPEIRSEEEWDEYDQEPRVVIYRSGDVTGGVFRERYEREKPLRGLGTSLYVA